MEKIVSITNARKDLYNLVAEVNNESTPVLLTNSKGANAVLVGESDWNSIMETLYISSVPGLKEKLLEGKNTSLDDCVSARKIEW
ncbi:MAG: type II toxin-antitoxin system Phd/YefM family antitoxin [Succinivibrio sp.]|nr:type II toxin-antitoxin system Phd/YefM family antitoxin [Succinivibrio sp.]